MNLRKLVNIRNAKQINALVDETEVIKKRCETIASQEYKEQKENQRTHDSRCPKCRANKIVDKIANVEGSGKVSGSFYLGFGNVSGSMSIDTNVVNHCNNPDCGHQWKKFKTKYVSKTDILRVTLNYLSDIISNPEHNRKLSWKIEAVKVFDDCHAEAITMVANEETRYLRSKGYLRNAVLRKYYPSIFDGENKKYLLNL